MVRIHQGALVTARVLSDTGSPFLLLIQVCAHLGRGRLCRAEEGAVLRRVRRDEVLEVIEAQARLWADCEGSAGC